MEDLAAVLAFNVDLLKIPFTIWGFTLSWWDILLYSMIASIVIAVLVVIIRD